MNAKAKQFQINEKQIRELMKLESNKMCFDCTEKVYFVFFSVVYWIKRDQCTFVLILGHMFVRIVRAYTVISIGK
jgi:hypothetical protein